MDQAALGSPRIDPVLAALALAGAGSAFLVPFYQFAPNRIVGGTSWFLVPASLPAALGLLLGWLGIGAFACLSPSVRRAAGARWAWLLVPVPVLAALAGAARVSWALAGTNAVARVTLGDRIQTARAQETRAAPPGPPGPAPGPGAMPSGHRPPPEPKR